MSLGEKYFTGLVWQDFQHRQLMDLFFKVKDARTRDAGGDVFRYSLAFLAMYVNHHFKLEEEYMDIFYYPDSKLHKNEHKEFVKRIKHYREAILEKKESDAEDKLIRALNSWILEHILGDDKKLGTYILECERKQAIENRAGS